MEPTIGSSRDSTRWPVKSNTCTRTIEEACNASVSTLSAKPNFTPFIATVTTLVVISLEEDSSLLLELEDSTELLEDFESLDFAELEDAASELEDATTLELDCTAELLDCAELLED